MPATSIIEEAFAHHQEGRSDKAEALYRTLLETEPDNFQALQLLGTLALRSQRFDEAVLLLQEALSSIKRRGDEAPQHAFLYNNIGIALYSAGRSAEATTFFNQGLKLDPNLLELHMSLAKTLMQQGDFAAAATCYETALKIDQNSLESICNLGTAYARTGHLEEAIALYRRALSISPSHKVTRVNLAQLLRRTEKYDEAVLLLTQLIKEYPADLSLHGHLGAVYGVSYRLDLALNHFRKVLAEEPNNAEALQFVANIQQSLGQAEEAAENYRRSFELRPLITITATQSPPAFRVILLFAPGAGNTPLDCLVDQASYESNLLNLLPNTNYDIDMLRHHADVVVNLIADVDQGKAMLGPAAELVDRIGKPIVNHPDKIKSTDRESIARLLQGLPGCRVPWTSRQPGVALLAPNFDFGGLPFSFPFLVRPVGTHGGVDFEKIHDQAELHTFIRKNPEADYYLTECVDYRSADGLFRKYRFIYVNDEILPYHLAIDDKWKVHHVTTDMINNSWMQEEEKFFLDHPQAVFNPTQYEALRAIQRKVGLDYFGIDCALDQEGRIVVFEVNACMLVHRHNENFPYKEKSVRRIKEAFNHMLSSMVTSK